MRPINGLVSQLKADFPAIRFESGNDFCWSASRSTLVYNRTTQKAALFLLHELAHALLHHDSFQLDIELLRKEREAWDLVRKELAASYGVDADEDVIEKSLETYREWLHSRSLCPTCQTTGLQTKTNIYVCINCRCSWRSNDARLAALRRTVIT